MERTPTSACPVLGEGRLLETKVAIITGASRGIGAAAAHAFAAAGATVVLAARSEDDLESVAAQIRGGGGEALAIPTDVGDPAAAARLVARTLAAFGRLDVAFNNAGDGHMPTPLADVALADFDTVLRVNVRGIFLMMKHQIPAMLAAGGGAIVNMSSTAGLSGAPGMAAYTAAKHAIVGLTEPPRSTTGHKESGSTRSPPARSSPTTSPGPMMRPGRGSPATCPFADSASPKKSRPPPPGCVRIRRRSSPGPRSPSTAGSSPVPRRFDRGQPTGRRED
jgi:NADP-dependent 3-hydroxy acid dehydrogenase YdfG